MKPTMFVFMGGQGSGKGTFAHLLMQQHDFNYVEMGAILRNLPQNNPLYQKIIAGNLAKDEELFPLISKHITNDKDIIIDGFPRTIGQAKWLVENFADTFNIRVLFLDITEETMIAHIKNRIKEGGNRKDDSDENAVHKRIESFKTITMPAIQWLSTLKNIEFKDIKLPSDDIKTNFDFILKTIK
nr:nucleoside monophosphate kinase [Candidatus Enterousia merdequi]